VDAREGIFVSLELNKLLVEGWDVECGVNRVLIKGDSVEVVLLEFGGGLVEGSKRSLEIG